MWKKLNFANRTKENVAESASPTSDDEFKSRPYEIPTLQFHDVARQPQAPPSMSIHIPRHSLAASSVYSQRSPDPSADLNRPWQDDGPDISPPSSPDGLDVGRTRDYNDDGQVSPIEDATVVSKAPRQLSPNYGSQIPRLRKFSGNTRWDAHSGEPTTSSSGKMGTFSQGNPYYSPDDENTPPNNLRYADQLQKHGNLATRATYFASKGLKKTIKPKALEPWSRATGRTNFVDPVQDTPQEQKLSVPPKNPRRPSPAISPVESPSDAAYARSLAPGPGQGSGASSTTGAAHSRGRVDNNKYTHSPSATQQRGAYFGGSRRQDDDTLAQLTAGQPYPGVSDVSASSNKEDPVSRFSWTTCATGTTHRKSTSIAEVEGSPSSPTPPMPANMPSVLQQNGVQRKQVADSAPSTPGSMRKNPPSFPALKESILDRKRPIARDDLPTTPKAEDVPRPKMSVAGSRKPVGGTNRPSNFGLGISTAPAVKPLSTDASSIHSRNSNASMSVDAKSKALPKAPSILSTTLTKAHSPERSPADHIADLRQQMDDLSLRRANINRAIHNLTRSASEHQNPMLTDWRTAKEAERKVERLRAELDDVGMEERDLGLRLHRAYKRREREGAWEGTSALWVRRVTG